MESIRLEIGLILEQAVQDIDRLPDPTGNKVTEEGDIGVRNVMIGNPAIGSVADMAFPQQVIFNQCDVRPIGHGGVACPPAKGQLETDILRNDIAQAGFKRSGGNVLRVEAFDNPF